MAPYSPYLNPIENLWGVLVRKVYEGGKQFQFIEELKSPVLLSLEVIGKRTLENLVNSIHIEFTKLLITTDVPLHINNSLLLNLLNNLCLKFFFQSVSINIVCFI